MLDLIVLYLYNTIKMSLYTLNKHQVIFQKELSNLSSGGIYYVVIQQDMKKTNLTLNELKMYIKKSVKKYIERYANNKIDGEDIKYIAFFENTREFFMSQHTTAIVKTDFYSGFHFHLFVTGVDEYFIKELQYQLQKQKNKQHCILKFDWDIKNKLDDDFILYHTKQMMHGYSSELVLKNFEFVC